MLRNTACRAERQTIVTTIAQRQISKKQTKKKKIAQIVTIKLKEKYYKL